MNITEIDLENGAAWPVTKERLAEMAKDNASLQDMIGAMALEVDARSADPNHLQAKDCVIVSGCRRRGESGWALFNGELCEVGSSNDEDALCLRLVERRVTVTAGANGAVYEVEQSILYPPQEANASESGNTLEADEGDLTQQTVRVERVLEWYEDTTGGRNAIYWNSCRRLAVRAVPADMGEVWDEQPSGWNWDVGEEGNVFRAQIAGGRVHLSVDATVAFAAGTQTLTPILVEGMSIYTGMTKLCELYNRYAPEGDRLVPVLVNGVVVPGVIHGGMLMIGRSLAFGDHVAVDTYYDL